MKRIAITIIGLAAILLSSVAYADKGNIASQMKAHNIFNTIELAANIGTTGLGLEVASPLTEWAKVRVGFDAMPHFKRHLQFSVENFSGDRLGANFDRINEMMSSQTGYSINRSVRMVSKPTMETFRFLIDVYPFKSNRHWHFTAGFFAGGSSIGTTINTSDDMASLMGVKMYQSLYRNATSEDFVNNPQKYPLFGFLTFEKEVAKRFQEKMLNVGQLGVYAGDNKDGSPCMLFPDEEGILELKTKVNAFRPYLGFGYGGSLSRDGKWQASFDAGVQFWGGIPKLTANDGAVINDLTNLSKETQSYIDFMKAIPVYPTIDLRISYRF
ncbi:MAG: hypothetical protein K2M16_04755 [Muribaculaceae bacterium]|nr:hypothetical protein [Muribaculaceae bacterium]